MIRQCSIRETKSRNAVVAKLVNDAATIQRPETQVMNQNSHDSACFDRRGPRKQFNPSQLEVSPFGERTPRPREPIPSLADDGTAGIDIDAGQRLFRKTNA